jgi:hypothetical protein
MLFDGFRRKNISQLESSRDSAHIYPIFLLIIFLQTSAHNLRIQITEENTLPYSVFNGIETHICNGFELTFRKLHVSLLDSASMHLHPPYFIKPRLHTF